jgi:hypothetical protein
MISVLRRDGSMIRTKEEKFKITAPSIVTPCKASFRRRLIPILRSSKISVVI